MTVTASSGVTATELALIAGIKTAAKAAIDASGIAVDSQALTVYDHEPQDADALPSVHILGPTDLELVHDEDRRNSRLGTIDWRLSFEVLIRTRMDTPEAGQDDLDGLVGAVVASINRLDPDLGLTAIGGAYITRGEVDLEGVVASTRVAQFTGTLSCLALTAN